MKKTTNQQWLWLAWSMLLMVSFAPAQGTNYFERLSDAAMLYKPSVDEAISHVSTNTPTEVSDFLLLSSQFAETMIGLPTDDVPTYSAKIDRLEKEKALWDAQLSVLRKRALTKDPACKIERNAFRTHIQPILNDRFIGENRAKGDLFELKYFEEDDKRSANFIEGFLNGKVPLLRYEEGNNSWYRQHGISAWEATARFEPIALMNSDKDLGGLVALGLVFNFFPEVDIDAENPLKVDTNTTFWSKYVKRVGLRLGAGATFDQGNALIGSGIQVQAFTVWGVFNTDDSEWYAAVGISEWDWIKKYLPYFGKE